MTTISRRDLIDLLASKSDLNQKDAHKFVEDLFEVIIKNLETGDSVKIHQFGNLNIRQKKARIGRNPKTNETYTISARKSVSFRTSNILKSKIRLLDNNSK